jgi:hypothetical protein
MLRHGQGAVQQAASAALRILTSALNASRGTTLACVVTLVETRGTTLRGVIAAQRPDFPFAPYNYGRNYACLPNHLELTGCSTTPVTCQGADGRKFEKHRRFVAAPNISPVLG